MYLIKMMEYALSNVLYLRYLYAQIFRSQNTM